MNPFHARLAALAIAQPAAPADQLARLRQLLLAVVRAEHEVLGRRPADLSQGLRLLAYERSLAPALTRRLHTLRRTANLVLHESYAGTAAEAAMGFEAVTELIELLTEISYPGPRLPEPTVAAGITAAPRQIAPSAYQINPEKNWRIHILGSNPAAGELLAEAETPGAGGAPEEAFRVRVPEAFAAVLAAAGQLRGRALLLNANLVANDDWAADASSGPALVQCQRLVLEPDYLINVTTIADCMDWKQALPEWALQKAFQPETASRSMVLGNLVNQLLDEEVSHAARHGESVTASLFTSSTPDIENTTSNQQQETRNQEQETPTGFDLEQFIRRRLFPLNALPLSIMEDFKSSQQIRELLDDLRRHHRTLRETRELGFAATSQTGYQQGQLRMADCFLEPSFLSATYGLQGRLDLLHESATGHDIIELKSSKSVPGGVPWASHVAQAQLYRLLLGSAFGEGESTRGRTSILYSAAAGGGLAVRPVLRDEPLVDAILACRNALVARELQLAQARGPRETAALLAPVFQPDAKRVPTYARDKANAVAQAWNRADKVEKNYCLELVRFGARELRLGLLGNDTRPGDAGGQAGLWRLTKSRKEQNFTLLDGLTLLENHADADNDARDGLGPHLVFQRPAHAAEVNFRAGDSLLLYPRQKVSVAPSLSLARTDAEEETPTNNSLIHSSTHSLIDKTHASTHSPLSPLDAQVVKVTLAEDLTPDGRIVLSLRNRRIAPRYLSQHSHWALEPDTYDTVRREWAALTRFLELPVLRRQRLLARREAGPRAPENWPADVLPATDAATVVARALAAPDWFVLCGPPGTGKTRKVLRELAERLHGLSQQTLLAAYTNRAVDEICEQLIEAGLPFIRVGSRLGTAVPYRRYLLDNMLMDCYSRQTVRDRLLTCPIFVGTITSLLTKPELFQLKQFDVAVVDEASQVLEAPMLALLGQVPKFILIGDHRQLPAVVVQDPQDSAIAPECADLLRDELGLTNLRNSYFERLFRRAEAHWPHAHGTLADQHRSHQELADLVNDDFYGGQLRCPSPWQSEVLSRAHWPAPAPDDALALALHTRRVVFVPTRRQPADRSMKESAHEADLAARAAVLVVQGEGASFDPATGLGIIASYRNQAARIRARLAQLAEELNLPALTAISVDTVERYQGSQREVIIVSFCCHHEHQLDLLVSPDETGTVDRKLNVALTRARQQLVLLGNEEVLAGAPHHAALLRRVLGYSTRRPE